MGLLMGFCFSHPEPRDQRTVSLEGKLRSSRNLHASITQYPAVPYFTKILIQIFYMIPLWIKVVFFFSKLSPQKIPIAQSDTYFRRGAKLMTLFLI